ncbi:alcohol dehydrogenase catalytic domain-containing protein, partial [Salmonella enterica subsp. enterica serovar Anatum]|nr:alcohol dehydrogenase catalytic domain-containing protein [Salmonella enterica subsp. enterica serovar Anatum]
PGIEQPDDIILRVTATAICGSDLHLYRGKIPQVKHGDIFGHDVQTVSFVGMIIDRKVLNNHLNDIHDELFLYYDDFFFGYKLV